MRFTDKFYYDNGSLKRLDNNEVVGWLCNNNYLMVDYLGKKHLVHRIIYELHYGDCPEFIDHINQNKLDNRIENLRPTTKRLNAFNSKIREDNSSGHRGISFGKSNQKWFVYIHVNGKRINGGYYTDFNEAILARKGLEEKYVLYS